MKLLFSGITASIYVKTYNDTPQVRHVMPSFYYKAFMKDLRKFDLVIVDSGAHTIQEQGKLKKLTEYVSEYKEFIKENNNRFDYFVELDIDQDTLVSTEKVDEIYEDLKKVGKICRVWHPCRGIDELKRYIKDYEIFGMSALEGLPKDLFRDVAVLCYKNGTKFHGFGCTRIDYLKDIPFYSVDASSALLGLTKYGRYKIFRNGRFETVRSVIKEKDDISMDLLHLQDVERLKVNSKNFNKLKHRFQKQLLSYVELEDYITELWQKRGIRWN